MFNQTENGQAPDIAFARKFLKIDAWTNSQRKKVVEVKVRAFLEQLFNLMPSPLVRDEFIWFVNVNQTQGVKNSWGLDKIGKI